MASELIVTPELLEMVKDMAYTGMSREDISSKLNRDIKTLFYNSKEKHPEIDSKYLEGKRANKEKLLKDIAELGDDSKSDDTKFKVKRYELAIKHKVIEQTKTEVTGKDGKALIPDTINIKIGG